MAIPTSRTTEAAEIRIDTVLCSGCGKCVQVCKDYSLILQNHKAAINPNPIFGCIACGHCMAICPEGAIEIYGRTTSPDDLFELPSIESTSRVTKIFWLYVNAAEVSENLRTKPYRPKL